jgi:2-C-methyl-D-erythritol 4-phosphate cytidylyltransferase
VNKIVLIVAGGIGTRMNKSTPKQFLELNGQPVLMHTVNVFYRYDPSIEIILVLPENQWKAWGNLCTRHQFGIKHILKSGGETRFHSVKKNISDFPDGSLIAIHDGVRPLVSLNTIERCFTEALQFGNAIPCIGIPETLRKTEEDKTIQVDRTHYRLIQTPQVFESSILKKAYMQEFQENFTDDAGVVENMGHKIHLVAGNPENIKITIDMDMVIASALQLHFNPNQGS